MEAERNSSFPIVSDVSVEPWLLMSLLPSFSKRKLGGYDANRLRADEAPVGRSIAMSDPMVSVRYYMP